MEAWEMKSAQNQAGSADKMRTLAIIVRPRAETPVTEAEILDSLQSAVSSNLIEKIEIVQVTDPTPDDFDEEEWRKRRDQL